MTDEGYVSEGSWIRAGERVDQLRTGRLSIIQNPRMFCFGTDAVLLSHFARPVRGDRVLDLGTGTGVIPLLLADRVPGISVTGVEVQPQMADMAARSVAMNALDEHIQIRCIDMRRLSTRQKPGDPFSPPYDYVVANPPYRADGGGAQSARDGIRIARHEVLCTLEDVVRAAAGQLKTRGRFALIHQAERAAEVIFTMMRFQIHPKRLLPVAPAPDKAPNLVLIEGIFQGAPGLAFMPTLHVYGEDGGYTPQMLAIYETEAQL